MHPTCGSNAGTTGFRWTEAALAAAVISQRMRGHGSNKRRGSSDCPLAPHSCPFAIMPFSRCNAMLLP